ncbi:hypothetical protein H9X96_13210 [Pedobacter sp. N36a]|uniref:hypothetical protein n=1 Tax=Pedobacter sp. N36a TaxID=2767996 RepID=UPI0016571C52|nr:hypothetical protein [Pedobacter sp. N36a]MBC8986735.1 hypothetical protein [Pedobacter sp. N36a]
MAYLNQMRKHSLLSILFTVVLASFCCGQELKPDTLLKDLDADQHPDSIFFDKASARIICKLSSQGFQEIKSKEIENIDLVMTGIRALENGFEFFNNWMRAGYTCFFRYDKNSKKIRLASMSRYEFGNAANDGSGNSSINLVTHQYIGNWNYYNEEKEKLIKMPVIKKSWVLPVTALEDFSDQEVEQYTYKCSDFMETLKTKMRKRE